MPREPSARKRWPRGSGLELVPYDLFRICPQLEFKSQEKGATLARLAASYAFGIARNHAFVDGNKRTALVVCLGFLRFNGMTITATREDRYLAFLSLAAGEMTEAEMTEWLEGNIVPLQPAPVTK